ncbi:BTAD domain-containing putative transcriptional regulator [Dongia sp.]|uniref:BTAD domain-containing putative transcriptional regulator n=1 Tax=Dongia sp. TaxID=1977262 RepID=UPI0037534DEE
MRKALCLLAFLALQPNGRATRDRILALLWSDRDQGQAQVSLRQALAEIRRCFGEDADDLLQTTRDAVTLVVSRFSIDILRAEELLAAGTPEALLEAASLWRGQILADVSPPDPAFEDWLSVERIQRQEQISQSLIAAIAAAERFSSDADVVPLAEGLLRINPSEEIAFRALIAVDLKRGERGKAMQRYAACCEALARDLDAKPSAALRALIGAMPTAVPSPRPVPLEPPRATAPRRSIAIPSVVMTTRPPLGPPEQVRDLALLVAEEFAISLGKLRSIAVLLPRNLGAGEDADYELTTSVRSLGARVQVTFQLVSRASDRLLLADRLELDPRALERIHLEIARMAFEVELAIGRDRMAEQAARDGARAPDPYALWLEGDRLTDSFDAEDLKRAIPIFEAAAAADPGFARPVASLASIKLSLPMIEGTGSLAADVFDEALILAKKAVNIDPWDPKCRIILAWAYMRKSMYAQGTREFEKALTLTRDDPSVLVAAAEGLSYLGETSRAVAYGERALALHPVAPDYYHHYLAVSYTAAGAYQRALEQCQSAPMGIPEHAALRAVILNEMGNKNEAQAAANEFISRAEGSWTGHDPFQPTKALEWYGQILVVADSRRRQRYTTQIARLLSLTSYKLVS